MRMMLQSLHPTVKYDEEADFSTQNLGITGDFNQSFSAEAKQPGVNEFFILQCKLSQESRHCENNVRIWDAKKFFLAPIEPTKAGVGLHLGQCLLQV
jgi:hypothetical protein